MLKIYFIEYDENGNEIRRGVHPGKEYKSRGWAWKLAMDIYGDHNRFEVYICEKEPWGITYDECICQICNKPYVNKIRGDGLGLFGTSVHGLGLFGTSVYVSDYREYSEFKTRKQIRESGYIRPKTYHNYRTCPDCFDKINIFIDGLKAKEN